MPFEVYDFRDVNKNVLTTPEIRARLYHMEPGQVDRLHSHDLGHEIFLILEGKAEFMIADHIEVLEAGQMCVALADEIHQVRNLLPDRRTVMFLSVTPHIQPTHTGRDPDGSVHPPQFRSNSFYDDEDDTRPIADLLEVFVDGANALADEARQAAAAHAQTSRTLAPGRRRRGPGRSRNRTQRHVGCRPQPAHQPLQSRPHLEQTSAKSRPKHHRPVNPPGQ